MSDDAVKSAEDFKDAMEDLKTSLQALTVESGVVKFFKDVADRLKAFITLEERAKRISTEDQKSIFFAKSFSTASSRGSLELEAFKKSRGGGGNMTRAERLGILQDQRKKAGVIASAEELATKELATKELATSPFGKEQAGTKITDAFQQVGGYLTEQRGVSPTNMAELTERTNSLLEMQTDILQQMVDHLSENGLTNNVDGARAE